VGFSLNVDSLHLQDIFSTTVCSTWWFDIGFYMLLATAKSRPDLIGCSYVNLCIGETSV